MKMIPPADTHTFSSAAEMFAHYAAVHKRIYGPAKQQEMQKIVEKPIRRGLQVETVISLVAAFYRVPVHDLLEGKTASLVRIRYVAMFLAYWFGKRPMRNIGRVMHYHINTSQQSV
jgi:chromosomal replication initiation ATPase DnaA